ncbi:MAG: SirB1 family protein [Pirellulales bacterium]
MPPSFSHDVEFCKLLAGRDDVGLIDLMLELAADAEPGLDAADCRRVLRELGDKARRRIDALSPAASLHDKLTAISRLLYVDEGFCGNRDEYYDPRNSLLNEVLERRMGIPITLAIVYQAVAAAAGVDVQGVGAPGHFVLRGEDDLASWYVDPFERGDVLEASACRQRIEELTGQVCAVGPEEFPPASTIEIVVRVLRNLKAAYALEEQWCEALAVQERLVLLLPDAPLEVRDLGLVYLRSGRPHQALCKLEEFTRDCGPQEARHLAPYLRTARRMAAEMN